MAFAATRAVVFAIFALLGLVAAGCTTSREGFKNGAIAPKDFFSDTAEGRSLDAKLEAGLDELKGLKGASVTASLEQRAESYASIFNAFSQDFRAAINAYYNGLVFAGGDVAARHSALPDYNRLVNYAHDRATKFQTFSLLVDAYKAKPDPQQLDKLGEAMKVLLSETAAAYPGDPKDVTPLRTQAATIEVGGLDKFRSDLIDLPKAELWDFAPDNSARLRTKFSVSGKSRITGNFDKTPFMERDRAAQIELLNVDDDGAQAFACAVKSDIGVDLIDGALKIGTDGDRSEGGVRCRADGNTFVIHRADVRDRGYYLAWRGATMTKEEFDRRYPGAEILLILTP